MMQDLMSLCVKVSLLLCRVCTVKEVPNETWSHDRRSKEHREAFRCQFPYKIEAVDLAALERMGVDLSPDGIQRFEAGVRSLGLEQGSAPCSGWSPRLWLGHTIACYHSDTIALLLLCGASFALFVCIQW